MQDILAASIRKLNKLKKRKTRMIAILLVLSFVVSLDVVWSLRLSGLTSDSCRGCSDFISFVGCFDDKISKKRKQAFDFERGR